jgi:hypothetical protein
VSYMDKLQGHGHWANDASSTDTIVVVRRSVAEEIARDADADLAALRQRCAEAEKERDTLRKKDEENA